MRTVALTITLLLGVSSFATAQERVTVTRKGNNLYEVQVDPYNRLIETSLCLELAIGEDAVLIEDRGKLLFKRSGTLCDVSRVLRPTITASKYQNVWAVGTESLNNSIAQRAEDQRKAEELRQLRLQNEALNRQLAPSRPAPIPERGRVWVLGGSKPFRQQVLNLIAATPELVPVSRARGGQPEVNLELKPGGAAVKCGSAKAFLPGSTPEEIVAAFRAWLPPYLAARRSR